MDQVLLVRNRYGTLYHVTRAHFDANKEAHGLVIIDERQSLVQHHPAPTGPTIRAEEIEVKGPTIITPNETGAGVPPFAATPAALPPKREPKRAPEPKRGGRPVGRGRK